MKHKNKWLAQINSQRDRYRQLCKEEPSICIFLKDFWQDAVCENDQWSAVLYERGGVIRGSLVFCYSLTNRGIVIHQPKLTQTSGVWIRQYEGKVEYRRLGYEKEVLYGLIAEIEKLPIERFSQHFTVDMTYWLPFYWREFKQTTRYTYRFMDIGNPDNVIRGFCNSRKKALNRIVSLNLAHAFDMPADVFYKHHVNTLQKKGKEIFYSQELITRIFDYVYERKCGRTIYSYDEKGNIHAACLFVWDDNCGYYLIASVDPDFSKSSSSVLLVVQIIKYLSSIGIKQFDLEGSMVEGIEQSHREYGTKQLQYFDINKDYRNRYEKTLDSLRYCLIAASKKGMRRIARKANRKR